MSAAICIVCRETLDLGQDPTDPSVAGDGNQERRLYGAKVCTTSCGHVMHVQCVYIWWKTITEQFISQGNVLGIGFGNQGLRAAAAAAGAPPNPNPNPAAVTYPCPLCGKLQVNPCVFELFMTFDSGSRGGNNGRGEKQELMSQVEELTAKNVQLSKHYDELRRQERERGLQASASSQGSPME